MKSLLHSSALLLLLLCFIQHDVAEGRALQCSINSLVITQAKTGNIVEGKPEYEVTVTNSCRCSQSAVVARCFGLSSVEPLNLQAIKPLDESNCVVNGGKAVPGGSAVRFKYAWLTPQDFPLVSSQIKC